MKKNDLSKTIFRWIAFVLLTVFTVSTLASGIVESIVHPDYFAGSLSKFMIFTVPLLTAVGAMTLGVGIIIRLTSAKKFTFIVIMLFVSGMFISMVSETAVYDPTFAIIFIIITQFIICLPLTAYLLYRNQNRKGDE